jgi:hypothetical protein
MCHLSSLILIQDLFAHFNHALKQSVLFLAMFGSNTSVTL